MNKPKEIWVFSNYNFKVIGPCTIVGENDDGDCWKYEHSSSNYTYLVPKDKVFLNRKQAVEACYKYHDELIKQAQANLNERKRLLKNFYSEELYG